MTTHKCPNCGCVDDCIIKDENLNPHYCNGCGFEWIVRSGEIEAIG